MAYPQPVPVLIALGANLPSQYGPPLATLAAALARLDRGKLRLLARSPWYESEPVPASDQPWYVNAVIAGVTSENPDNILKYLHEVEKDFGRARGTANAARSLDLDLLAFGDAVRTTDAPSHGIAVLPHPRMQDRAFVLRPLADVAPNWRHPVLKATAAELIARLPAGPGLRLARVSAAAQ